MTAPDFWGRQEALFDGHSYYEPGRETPWVPDELMDYHDLYGATIGRSKRAWQPDNEDDEFEQDDKDWSDWL